MSAGGTRRRAAGARARRRAGIGASAGLIALLGLGLSGTVGTTALAQDQDPILELLQAAAAASGQEVVVDGDVVSLTDPSNDQQGLMDPGGDILGAWLLDVPMVPSYLLDEGGPFGCDTVVLCSEQGAAEPEVYDNGAWLVSLRLAGPAAGLAPGRRGEWGALFQLERYVPPPVEPSNPFGGYTHIIVGRQQGDMRGVFEYGIPTFDEYRTRTRVRLEGDSVALLVPKDRDLPTTPTAWGVYAYAADQANQGRDVLGAIGEPPTPIGTPPTLVFQEAAPPTSTPAATPVPPATTQPPATAAPEPTPGVGPPAGGTGQFPWLVLVPIGLLLVLLGGWLFLRGRGGTGEPAPSPASGPAPAGPGGPGPGGPMPAGPGGRAVAVSSTIGDPCPPLIEAARRARAACEEAAKAADDAEQAARDRAAEADRARRDLDDAREAREAAEREVERRREEPDRSSWAQSGNRYEDSYDLKLKADARAAANAAHSDAVNNARTDGERRQAHEDWQQQLDHIDSPEGLDELRQRDKDGRATWVEEAQEALDAAREAEARAQEGANRASEAAEVAETEARAARERADEACARAEAARQAAIDAGCMTADGTPVPPKPAAPPSPEPPAPPPVPPTPPTAPTPPIPPTPPTGPGGPVSTPPSPPTPPTRERPRERCPDGAEPRVSERNSIEVDLYLISESQLQIDSNYPYGEDIDDALDDLDSRLAVIGAVMALPDAVTQPVPSLLGTLGVPGFDTTITAPADAAAKSLRRLRERFERFRRTGTWSLSVPLQHYRFFCRITEECIDGAWVETKREFAGERIGKPRYVESVSYDVQDVRYDANRAWITMSTPFTRRNADAERQIAEAMRACGG